MHGPVVRNHGHDLNKKVRSLGLKSALSSKAKLGKLMIIDALKSDGKSSTLKKSLDMLGLKNVLFITGENEDLNFMRAASNIIHIDVLSHAGLNVYDIIRKDNLIIADDAIKLLEGRFA